jgi:hypothetical protein
MIIENQTVLKAEEGKLLTNGETFGTVVYLAENDSPNNWREIDETEAEEICQND